MSRDVCFYDDGPTTLCGKRLAVIPARYLTQDTSATITCYECHQKALDDGRINTDCPWCGGHVDRELGDGYCVDCGRDPDQG